MIGFPRSGLVFPPLVPSVAIVFVRFRQIVKKWLK